MNRCETESAISAFAAALTHRPPQGSREWLLGRRRIIGGSDVASLFDENPYSRPFELARDKLGAGTFVGNTATRWGVLFESASARIFEYRHGTRVYDCRTVPGSTANLAYSPDGISAIDAAELCGLPCARHTTGAKRTGRPMAVVETAGDFAGEGMRCVLLEIKSPLGRVPSGMIPGHYIHQPLAGLSAIGIADLAVFIDVRFRIVTSRGKPHPFHGDTEEGPVLHRGIVGIYDCRPGDTSMIDYCDTYSTAAGFDAALVHLSEKPVTVWVPTPDQPVGACLDEFLDYCESRHVRPLGFVRWTVTAYAETVVCRDAGFEAKLVLESDRFMENIRQCTESENPLATCAKIWGKNSVSAYPIDMLGG